MKVAIDDLVAIVQPKQINWIPPEILAKDGNRAPVYAPYYGCRLSVNITTTVRHEDWFDKVDSESHTIRLPHPHSGTMTDFTGFVDMVVGSFIAADADCVAMSGFDVELSGILVT